MANFKLRRSKLRGTDSARLRGEPTAVTTGTIYPGTATAGQVRQPHTATTMVPGSQPRAGAVVVGVNVTPTARAGILKRGSVTASRGNVAPARVTASPTTGRRSASGRVAVPHSAVAPVPQTRDSVTGASPKTGTPTATATPKVRGKATGSRKIPKPGTGPGRSR